MRKRLREYEITAVAQAVGLAGELDNNSKYDDPFGPLVQPLSGTFPFLTRIDTFTIRKGADSKAEIHITREISKVSWFHNTTITNTVYPAWEEHVPRFCKDRLLRRVPERKHEYQYYKFLFDMRDSTYIITERQKVVERVFLNTEHPKFDLEAIIVCLEEYRKSVVPVHIHFAKSGRPL